MNRVSSLVFATATTALTGAAVVMAAGGTIFGLDKITPSGGQPQQAASSASAPLVRASFQQEIAAETAVAAVETEIPFAAGGWAQGATGGESEAIAPEAPAPQPTGFAERSTPPPATATAPAAPTSPSPTAVAPPPTAQPELTEPPSFVMPPNEPKASAKAQAPATPTAPPAAAQAPASPTAPAAPASTPTSWMDDDDDDQDEDDDHDEDEDEEEDDD